MRFGESVRGADAFVLQSHAAPINKSIMEQLIMVDALKRASAARITVVAPCYGYARQDKKHRGREPISARLMADLFKTAGAAPHHVRRPAHRADPGLLRRPGRPPLGDAPPRAVRPHARRAGQPHRRLAGCRPRASRRPVVRLSRAPHSRSSTSGAIRACRTRSSVHELVGEVEGRTCVIVDDMIDTGGTIVQAAEALFENGAPRRSLSRRPTACFPAQRSSGFASRGSPRWSSPTRCRSPTTSGARA